MEDVKTLLRSFIVVFIGTALLGIVAASVQLLKSVSDMLVNSDDRISSMCYTKKRFINSFSYGSVIVLPLCELIFYPTFRGFFDLVNSYCHWKHLGVFLAIAEIILLLVIEIVARHNYLLSSNYNLLSHA